jgi:predicted transposase YdaD
MGITLAKGRAEGEAKGRAEGEAKGRAIDALKMLKRGLPISLISEITELSETEIKALDV